jgi:hypothetical protein
VADVDSSTLKVQTAKKYLGDERFKLKLYDLVACEVRDILFQTGRLSYETSWSLKEFEERLRTYEAACKVLLPIQALVGFWGKKEHYNLLTLGPKRITSEGRPQSGVQGWLNLRFYPALLLLYSSGIAAVAANRYDNLHELLFAKAPALNDQSRESRLVLSLGSAAEDLQDAFKHLAGHEQQYVPRGEYTYQFLQPIFEDLFLLGPEYELAFDRFEVLFALEHAFLNSLQARNGWGPRGRFVWKLSRGFGSDPFTQMITEAEAERSQWPPLQVGFFGGSFENFKELASKYRTVIAQSRAW